MVINIIIPVYNAEKFLGRCLDSVLAQTYGSWRAIVVDDGSTDQSGAIADAYQQKDERFFVIHKQNEGQSKARLDGFSAADGDVVMFLDGDDYWKPDCLEKITDAFAEYAPDIVMFPSLVVEADGAKRRVIGKTAEKSGYLDKKSICEKLIASHELNSLCLKAFKRTVLDKEELKKAADQGVRIAEDKLMLLPIITRANKIYYLNDELYVYVHHEQSTSHCCLGSKISEIIAKPVFLETYRHLDIWNLNDERHRRMLAVYYLKNFMDCYYIIRRCCTAEAEREKFKQYPWKETLGVRVGKYLLGNDLTVKEKIKLIAMRMSI